jgi:hypothetical protein
MVMEICFGEGCSVEKSGGFQICKYGGWLVVGALRRLGVLLGSEFGRVLGGDGMRLQLM